MRWKSLIDFFCPSPKIEDRLACFRSLPLDQCLNDTSIPTPIRLGINNFLYNRLLAAFGEKKTWELAQILNSPAPLTIRANALKTTRDELLQKFSNYEPTPCEMAPFGIQFKKRIPLFTLPEFKMGLFEVQDEGSQLIASAVEAKPGDLIIDYCSGSGGKTLAFAPKMEGKGQIYLHDIRPWILLEARKRLRRAGIQNGQCIGTEHPQMKAMIGKADWVLVDVPCSGTGTLRRNPDAKWKIDAPLVQRLVQEQRMIFEKALLYLKKGGRIVYATCSLLPEENEEQTAFFLSRFPVALEKEPLRLLPQQGGMDGFYSALFRKI